MDVEVTRKQAELFDRLPALQAGVELPDVAINDLDGLRVDGLRVGGHLGVCFSGQAVLGGPQHDRGLVQADQSGAAVVTLVAEDQDVTDKRAEGLEPVLNVAGCDVLPPEVLNMSFFRSVTVKYPFLSTSPMSPVWSQPSHSSTSAVWAGRPLVRCPRPARPMGNPGDAPA